MHADNFLIFKFQEIQKQCNILFLCQKLITNHYLLASAIQNASITLTVQGITFESFGIIGAQAHSSVHAEVINLRASVRILTNSDKSLYIGSIFGVLQAENGLVQNSRIIGANISSGSYFGGFMGAISNNLTILNSSVSQTSILGNTAGGLISQMKSGSAAIHNSTICNTNISGIIAGGFIGQCSSNLFIKDSKIQFTRIFGDVNAGIIIGDNYGTYSFVNSSSISNFVNNVLQNDCSSQDQFIDGC
ncbi:Pectin_lyase fold/virulence factor [Hexamita inflata]|uniref:Pectin lyase fold/virulence factor n=1 Tax=Hexamita inflata TaxID=28002 RepID=A0AA86TQZ6_9EUKA|nr:Pectin lyase fold/virulence factor [Hexamita inflata]